MPTEQKESAAAKRRATLERKRQRAQELKRERERTIKALQEVRDSADANPDTRLRAIELLSELMPKY